MTPAGAELALFVRPVVEGGVKTRLAAAVGPRLAARLYRAFVVDTLRAASREPRLSPRLWVAGDPQHPSLADLGSRAPRQRQPEGDLGRRLARALEEGLRRRGAAIALGTDAPSLPPSYLGQALGRLSRAPLVLGPAADGGYYLIGVRAGVELGPLLSTVRWSSRHALADTLAGARGAGLAVELLPPWYDVDTARDLQLLALHLRLAPGAAMATAQVLRASRDSLADAVAVL